MILYKLKRVSSSRPTGRLYLLRYKASAGEEPEGVRIENGRGGAGCEAGGKLYGNKENAN